VGTVSDIGFASQGFGGIRATVPADEDQPHAGADAMSVARHLADTAHHRFRFIDSFPLAGRRRAARPSCARAWWNPA